MAASTCISPNVGLRGVSSIQWREHERGEGMNYLNRGIGRFALLCCLLLFVVSLAGFAATTVRFATFNVSLYRDQPGQLLRELSPGSNAQAMAIAEIIQHVRPDVLLINEFDYDEDGLAAAAFRDLYLAVGQNGASPMDYGYVYVAPSNTGVPSGHDLNNNGAVGGAGDAFGYGEFEGQYGMVLFSRYPIATGQVRTFQSFLWADMPGALLPVNWYSAAELQAVRLSSKNHLDIPIEIDAEVVHVLACHPTPPVFDGPEDANGRRNHDEIRFWADYVDPSLSGYVYDDAGQSGGLNGYADFVIMGDMNADPFDGDSTAQAILQLLNSPWVKTLISPESEGAAEQAHLQGGANRLHQGDPDYDTADFSESTGNLRVDYVLPSMTLSVSSAGVFWPLSDDPLFSLVGVYPFPGSDHRLVWMDITFP